jgi:hypothetical protein
MDDDPHQLKRRIKDLEQCLAPFAKLGGPIGFQPSSDDSATALTTLAGTVTVGDFRRAAAALRQTVAAGSVAPRY